VTLANRRSSALVDHISALRAAFRVCRRERPFAIDAIVVLPDHLHAILTLQPHVPCAHAGYSLPRSQAHQQIPYASLDHLIGAAE
jgi:REP element-mobilizing transposase RayT